jgi:hypothetical protein
MSAKRRPKPKRFRRDRSRSPYTTLVDSRTGERFVLVDHLLHFVRNRHEPNISRIELIARMRAVGWEFRYIEAANPKDPREVIGVDLFVVPRDWERRAA